MSYHALEVSHADGNGDRPEGGVEAAEQGGEKRFRREHFESLDETRRNRRKNRRRIH
jgi:hypothetical protein